MSRTITTHDLGLDDTISGAQFRDFYQNHWPTEWFVEEFHVDFEDEVGNFILPDEARIKLDSIGWAGWQGAGDPPDRRRSQMIGKLYIEAMSSFTEEAVVSFRLPRDQLDALIAAAEALGARKI